MTYDSARRFRWLLWQNYRGNGISDQEVWMDDLYIQTGSYARIEIGNNASHALATKTEIQRPLAWAGDEIDVEVNLGGFTGAETLYVYVIGADGTASAGFELTL